MSFIWQGNISKLDAKLSNGFVKYSLNGVCLNERLGQEINIRFLEKIICKHCQKSIKKTYGDGFCFQCFSTLAACDLCILKPELCHFDKGTCRDEEWGKKHCFQDHFVYLSFTSGIKVGITRHTQIPTRWIDQGAIEALPILKVSNRKLSGELEHLFSEVMNDKTHWSKMLKTFESKECLIAQKELLFDTFGEQLDDFENIYAGEIEFLEENIVHLNFPINNYPEKIKSTNLDKVSSLTGIISGIKGQYLMTKDWVFNFRRHSGYLVEILIK